MFTRPTLCRPHHALPHVAPQGNFAGAGGPASLTIAGVLVSAIIIVSLIAMES
jgi:hypothetical protein